MIQGEINLGKERLLSKALSLNLGGVEMKFDNGKWALNPDILQQATREINQLMEEREKLLIDLGESQMYVEALREEVLEINDLKRVSLEMVNAK